MTIYLVRHGETEWNRVGRQQGRLDSPLTTVGVRQARSIATRLRSLIEPDQEFCIETSPLGRARRTASIIGEALGADTKKLVVTAQLIEHDWGAWQGLTFAEIEDEFPGALAKRDADKWTFPVPGGESYAAISERAESWLSHDHRGSVIVAVTHEMLSRTIQGAYLRLPPGQVLRRSHSQGRILVLHDGVIDQL